MPPAGDQSAIPAACRSAENHQARNDEDRVERIITGDVQRPAAEQEIDTANDSRVKEPERSALESFPEREGDDNTESEYGHTTEHPSDLYSALEIGGDFLSLELRMHLLPAVDGMRTAAGQHNDASNETDEGEYFFH